MKEDKVVATVIISCAITIAVILMGFILFAGYDNKRHYVHLQHTLDSVYTDLQYDSAKIEYLEGQVDYLQECKSRIP